MSKKILLIPFLILGLSILSGCTKIEGDQAVGNNINTQAENLDDHVLTPEEVLANMDAAEQAEADVEPSVKIVSPEGDKITTGQARLIQAEITFPKTPQNYCACNWKFYLNQYSEEELWKEQETNCANNACTFTNIIDHNGQLRLHVDLVEKIHNSDEENILMSDERNYLVAQ